MIRTTLLAFVPLSYMVVSKRVVENKFFTIPSAFPSNTSMSTLPSVKEIDVDDNSITRKRTTLQASLSLEVFQCLLVHLQWHIMTK